MVCSTPTEATVKLYIFVYNQKHSLGSRVHTHIDCPNTAQILQEYRETPQDTTKNNDSIPVRVSTVLYVFEISRNIVC